MGDAKTKKINKKGIMQSIGMAMVVFFTLSIIILVGKLTMNEFTVRASNTTGFNQSQLAIDSLNDVNTLTNRFDYLAFAVFIGLAMAIIISGWLVSGNPILSFFYFIVMVIFVAMGSVFAFVWNQVSNNVLLAPTVENMPITEFILNNFPLLIAVIGFAGLVALFAKPFQQ